MGRFSFVSEPGQGKSNAKPRKKKSARKRLYELHTWVGFHLAVIMALVLATGTFATVSNELDWLTQHDMRVAPDGDKVGWQEMVEAVSAHAPDATIASIHKGEGDHFAYRSTILTHDGIRKYIHVNQWTGDVTGETGAFTFQYFFRNLHRYLFLPSVLGLTLVSSMAIILAISLYTGLKTSRNWRRLMTRVRVSKGARTAIGDAHKAAGLWSIWFFVLMIVTGLWYYAEFVGSNFEPRYTQLSQERVAELGDTLIDPPVSDVIEAAQTAYPELKIQAIAFGVMGRVPIMVDGSAGNPIVRSRANRVYLDPITLEVLHIQRDKELGWLQWLNQIADPLHFGDFGGLPVKLIWFTFGLFMTGLSLSGVWLTWRRLKSKGASKMQIAALPIVLAASIMGALHYTMLQIPMLNGVDILPPAWFVMGLFFAGGALFGLVSLVKRLRHAPRFGWKNLLVFAVTAAAMTGAVHATVLQQPFHKPPEVSLGAMTDGPISAELSLARLPDGTFLGGGRLMIRGIDGRLYAKSVSVVLLKDAAPVDAETDPIKRRLPMRSHIQTQFIDLPPELLARASHVQAQFEMESGATYQVSWSLPGRK